MWASVVLANAFCLSHYIGGLMRLESGKFEGRNSKFPPTQQECGRRLRCSFKGESSFLTKILLSPYSKNRRYPSSKYVLGMTLRNSRTP